MSSAVQPYLWLIPGLPLLASVVTAFLGPRLLRNQSHWPCILAVVAAFFLSAAVFLTVKGAEGEQPAGVAVYYPWIQAGHVDVGINLRADALSAMMLVMITFIGSFIAIYSIGYMAGDPGYPRFFACVALFIFSMTTLVLGDNFLVMFAGWEGVGLCSYLLIGFWFQKESAAAAARKAFLVTRIGDVGLLLGILLLWMMYGTLNYWDVRDASGDLLYSGVFSRVEEELRNQTANRGLLLAAALLLFCGAAGKSAQFPLHVWLPDAMEGPTPVSALIHAATMVTAGVYLVARCTPIFLAAPEAQLTVASIGGFTALLAALIALTQNDLKRVLAYSTLSQLGYMFLALGCGVLAGGKYLVTFAVTAAMFHLFTHAFFKALLFLSAGSVMTAMGHVIDMRRFSGLRQVMPTTHLTFLCGALALSGFPLLSGFWSKDEILDACWQASTSPAAEASIYRVLLVVGVVTAGLTAFYTFRAYFKTFWGELKIPEEAHAHAHGGHASHGGHNSHGHEPSHESPAVMTGPLMVLSVFAVGVGFLLGPVMPEGMQFAHFLEKTPGFPRDHHEHGMNLPLMAISTLAALGGIALAWLMYVKQTDLPAKFAKSIQGLYQLSLNKFYLDELYAAFIVRPAQWLAGVARRVDTGAIDSGVDLVGNGPRLLGELFRPIQNGLVQFYALAMVLGLTVFLLSLIYKL
jgi:NADH-quinone oxidoreductase subunit L